MRYTTHGAMTPEDMQEYRADHDLVPDDECAELLCPLCDHGVFTKAEAGGVAALVVLAPGLLAEVERLRGIVAAVGELHRPMTVREECRCDEIGEPCECQPYDVCSQCCGTPTEQDERCAAEHDHGPGRPACATRAALGGEAT